MASIFALGSAPIVDHVGICPIESFGMRTLHGDTLRRHSISA